MPALQLSNNNHTNKILILQEYEKKKIGLCAVALLCMSGTAKAALPALKQDNTKVVNHAQITAAYKTNRPAVKNRLYTSQAVEAEILRVKSY